MGVRLAQPRGDDRTDSAAPYSAGDWYLERRESLDSAVDTFRPLFQGDVFIGVPLEAVPLTGNRLDIPEDRTELTNAVLLIGHPCSMVAGSDLLPYQEVVRVRPSQEVRYDDYDRTRFEEFFLPFLDPTEPTIHYSAWLHERALVNTSVLHLANRVAALSLEGVVGLQQRITHEATRVKVAENLLREATSPRFHENQLAQEWNESVLGKQRLEGSVLLAAMDREAEAFERALSAPIKTVDEQSGYVLATTLREQMFNLSNEGRVNVAVRKHMKLRSNVLATERQQAQQRAAREAKQAVEAHPEAASVGVRSLSGQAPDQERDV